MHQRGLAASLALTPEMPVAHSPSPMRTARSISRHCCRLQDLPGGEPLPALDSRTHVCLLSPACMGGGGCGIPQVTCHVPRTPKPPAHAPSHQPGGVPATRTVLLTSSPEGTPWGPPREVALKTAGWKVSPERPHRGPEACSEWAGSTVTKLFPPKLAFSVSLPRTHPSHTALSEHVSRCKCIA